MYANFYSIIIKFPFLVYNYTLKKLNAVYLAVVAGTASNLGDGEAEECDKQWLVGGMPG